MCGEDCGGCEVCCEVIEDNLCGCGNEGTSLHTCPFSEEINGDSTTLCNCCYECCHECAMDI